MRQGFFALAYYFFINKIHPKSLNIRLLGCYYYELLLIAYLLIRRVVFLEPSEYVMRTMFMPRWGADIFMPFRL